MKTFIGPRLRRLRREKNQTQAQMAKALGISISYVNMLEKNERSVSVPVLLQLFQTYGVDWREIADEDEVATLANLRSAFQDPLFENHVPDLAQLRSLMSDAPDVTQSFLKLLTVYRSATDRLLSLTNASETDLRLLSASPSRLFMIFSAKTGTILVNLKKRLKISGKTSDHKAMIFMRR